MSNILKIKRTQDLEFSGDEFKVVNKKDNFKFVGELIADYVTSSINSFNDEYRHMRDDREFIFVSDDYSHLDSFLEAKEKIEIFSYKFNNDNEFNFIRDFFKCIRYLENDILLPIKRRPKYLTCEHNYGELLFTIKFYPGSNTKLVILEYKGNKLIEFSEYIEFGIKIIEHIHPIFSTWDTKIENIENMNPYDWLADFIDLKTDGTTYNWFSILEEYVVNNI